LNFSDIFPAAFNLPRSLLYLNQSGQARLKLVDMAAHVRSILTTNELTIPIQNGRLALGTWQGVFLWEHRYRAHSRSIIVTVSS